MTMEATAAGAQPSTDFLGMSDDDFLKINSPDAPIAVASSADQAAVVTSDTTSSEGAQDASVEADPAAVSDAPAGSAEDPPATAAVASEDPNKPADAGAAPAKAAVPAQGTDKSAAPAEVDKDKNAAAPGSEKAPEAAQAEAVPVNYEDFFKQVMTPFKANGKTVELKSPEEVIRLMQMGAGYGRKMQELQPHLKTIRMLEKANLLDVDRLGFLIDINNKNPDAIKKLIKDTGIDPLDLNTGDTVNYRPTNHAVSDKEMAFSEALSDIQGQETGRETLQIINQTWDDESKNALWDEPSVLKVIQTQRDDGTYAKITAEVDRQKLLGHIPNSTPFLKAYVDVGNQMFPTAPSQPVQKQPGVTQQPQVIATRTLVPKPPVQNGDKASAAAPTNGNAPRGKGPAVNPLAMADDDFLKMFEGRLG